MISTKENQIAKGRHQCDIDLNLFDIQVLKLVIPYIWDVVF